MCGSWQTQSLAMIFRSLCLSEGAGKSVGSGSKNAETTVKMLPSQLLRRWRKAGRILNVTNALGKYKQNQGERFVL